jgi:hypothetical protein
VGTQEHLPEAEKCFVAFAKPGEDADLGLLEEAFESGLDSVADFICLREHGFRFYYLPNG